MLAPHAQLPGDVKMIASSWRTKLSRILTHFPDVAMIRIAYETAYCHLTQSSPGAAQESLKIQNGLKAALRLSAMVGI